MRIARVFPRRTSAAPDGPLARTFSTMVLQSIGSEAFARTSAARLRRLGFFSRGALDFFAALTPVSGAPSRPTLARVASVAPRAALASPTVPRRRRALLMRTFLPVAEKDDEDEPETNREAA